MSETNQAPELISDIVTLNRDIGAQIAVVLNDYYTERNPVLARSFIFTANAAPARVPSIEFLRRLKETVTGGGENRFMGLATFGHGKSHLGLAIANFFGKPLDSPEVSAILSNIEAAAGEAVRREFQSFKEASPKPYLPILLSGDQAIGLREMFMRALDRALGGTDGSVNAGLRFWFDEAIRFLSGLSPEQRAKAEAYLGEHETPGDELDLPRLIEDLRGWRFDRYNLTLGVSRHVLGVTPNFGGEVSLRKIVADIAERLCGPDGPYAGYFVVFDEFLPFTRSYWQLNPVGLALQELLTGVEETRGRSFCIAFSQMAPERVVPDDGSEQSALFRQQLKRFGDPRRLVLHSVVESVVSASFKVAERAFAGLPGAARDEIDDAAEIAFTSFRERYQNILGWSKAKFRSDLVYGCFPLHPLTTVILSTIQLELGGEVRGILGFVQEKTYPKESQPVLVGGRPNWVFATALVDFFKEMISESIYSRLNGNLNADMTEVERAVLKGVAIQMAGQVRTAGIGYATVIAHLTGLGVETADATLKSLAERAYLAHDQQSGAYHFFDGPPVHNLEALIVKELQGRKASGAYAQWFDVRKSTGTEIEAEISGIGDTVLGGYEVSVPWGSPTDWQADELLFTRESFKRATLEMLPARWDYRLGEENPRGAVIILLPKNDDDVQFFRNRAAEILDDVKELNDAPIVALVPADLPVGLVEAMARVKLLKEEHFRKETLNQLGTGASEMYMASRRRFETQVLEGMERLVRSARVLLPKGIRDKVSIVTTGPNGIAPGIKAAFKHAYRQSPKVFTDQYHARQSNLAGAVNLLWPFLVRNSLAQFVPNGSGPGKIAESLRDAYLDRAWKLTRGGGQLQKDFRLKEPDEDSPLRPAWNVLDASFKPGGKGLRITKVFARLLNAPYGYDVNTLTLLFCAWMGLHQEVTLQLDQRLVSPLQLKPIDFARPADLIKKLDAGFLSRENIDEIENEIRRIIAQVEQGATCPQDQASKDQAQLEVFIAKADPESLLGEQAKNVLGKLSADLGALSAYTKLAGAWKEILDANRDIDALMQIAREAPEAPFPAFVALALETPTAFAERGRQAATDLGRRRFKELAGLTQVTDFGQRQAELKQLNQKLTRTGLNLAAEFAAAATELDANLKRLQNQERAQERLRRVKQFPETERDGESGLANARQELRGMLEDASEALTEAITAKLRRVEDSLEKLAAFANALPERVQAVTTVKQAGDLQHEVGRVMDRYQPGAQAHGKLETAVERLGQLEAKLGPLRPPAFDSRRQAEELLKELSNLSVDEGLSETQRAKAEEVWQAARADLKKREASAQALLDQYKQALERGELDGLVERLRREPEFLPPEFFAGWEALRQAVARAIVDGEDEAKNLERVRALRVTDSLGELRARLHELDEIPGSTPAVTQAKGEKRASLEAAEAQRQEQLSRWQEAVDGVVTLKVARPLREELLRRMFQYQGEPEEPTVLGVQQRLDSALEALEAVDQATRASASSEIQAALAALRGLGNGLSADQKSTVAAAIQGLEARRDGLQRAAEKWLAERETALREAIRPVRVEDLGVRPDFLPAAADSRFEELRRGADTVNRFLEALRNLVPVTPVTPAEFEQRQQRLAALREEAPFAAQEQLLDRELSLLRRARDEKAAQVQRRFDELVNKVPGAKAFNQLRQIEGELEGAQATPWPFLGSSAVESLPGYLKVVRARMEDNEVEGIKARLALIKDRERLQVVLNEVQRLLAGASHEVGAP